MESTRAEWLEIHSAPRMVVCWADLRAAQWAESMVQSRAALMAMRSVATMAAQTAA